MASADLTTAITNLTTAANAAVAALTAEENKVATYIASLDALTATLNTAASNAGNAS